MLPNTVACYFYKKGAVTIQFKRYLGGYIRAISNAMGQEMQQNSERLGLTSTQGMFLHHLWLRQEIQKVPTYAKDLEDFFDIRHSTVSGVLQRMEAAGFVEVLASETDRRCKTIHLTQKAMDLHVETERQIMQAEERLVRGMSEAEIQEFRRLLRMAAANLDVCHKRPIPNNEKEESDL